MTENLFLLIFIVVIAFLLFLDLGILHKKDHVVTFRESATWTAIWVTLSLLFFVFLRLQGDMVVDVHDKEQFVAQNQLYDHQVTYDDALSWDENIKHYKRQLSLEYITGYRQRLCDDHDLPVVRGGEAILSQGVVLRHPRGDSAQVRLHLRGGCPHPAVPLAAAHIRCVPDLFGYQDVPRPEQRRVN